jgi:hypothetical protein
MDLRHLGIDESNGVNQVMGAIRLDVPSISLYYTSRQYCTNCLADTRTQRRDKQRYRRNRQQRQKRHGRKIRAANAGRDSKGKRYGGKADIQAKAQQTKASPQAETQAANQAEKTGRDEGRGRRLRMEIQIETQSRVTHAKIQEQQAEIGQVTDTATEKQA